MNSRFEIVRRGSDGYQIYSGKNGTRNAWTPAWNSGSGMWYSTAGSARRAMKRLKNSGYRKQVFFIRPIVDRPLVMAL